MKLSFTALLASVATLLGSAAASVQAVPVSIDVPMLRCIQTFTLGEGKTDNVYLLVTGVAKGESFQWHYPKGQADGSGAATVKASAKMPAITTKSPLTLWKGDLADGQFAMVTVTVMQGDGLTAAKEKEYLDKKAAAEAKAEARTQKTLASEDEFKSLAYLTNKGQHELVIGIKKIFSRQLKTDHFGGLFNLLVWNHDGKIVKRLDPVGLTFGEHYGTDVKVYSKIKYTRENVLYQDSNGKWYERQVDPLSEDETAIRVKMLETEYVKVPGEKDPVRNVTDYLADVTVTAGGKLLTWRLGGEVPGESILHDYWNWAY